MVVCWDGGKSIHRQAIFAGYKAARADKPAIEERGRQAVRPGQGVPALAGIHHVEQPGVEADDLVAAYWRHKGSQRAHVHPVAATRTSSSCSTAGPNRFGPAPGWTSGGQPTGCAASSVAVPSICPSHGADRGHVRQRPGYPGLWSQDGRASCLPSMTGALTRYWSARTTPSWWACGAYVERNLALVDLRYPLPGVTVQPLPRFVPTL